MKLSRKGFTLIELLVVVAIIGLLASVILIGLGPAQRSGRDARRAADLRTVQTALEVYFQAHGGYPATPAGTTASAQWSALAATLGVTLPSDPNASNTTSQYGYKQLSNNTYILGAQLEDASSKLMASSLTSGTTVNGTCGTAGYYCVGVQ